MIRKRTRRYLVRHNRERMRGLDKVMLPLKAIKTLFSDRVPRLPPKGETIEYLAAPELGEYTVRPL